MSFDGLLNTASESAPLTPEEWERVECLAKNFAARLDESPITYVRTIGTTADLSLLLRALDERTDERDRLREALEGIKVELYALVILPGPIDFMTALGASKSIDNECLIEALTLANAALAPQEPTG